MDARGSFTRGKVARA